ncbi:hypothetical protein [Peribacillus frigoritolerans]|uniref:hypothetical protein n=1 Tax=Peribacillus frigoritolerans TaxID=450367 RepID=UPI00227DF933|nr:hypothetical protein [Peribacillus frigoritolerans]MCY9141753.1 hypothetical protein [Peribacillus frigoritolerans]
MAVIIGIPVAIVFAQEVWIFTPFTTYTYFTNVLMSAAPMQLLISLSSLFTFFPSLLETCPMEVRIVWIQMATLLKKRWYN